MKRRVKAFCAPEEQEKLGERYAVIERYPGFLLIEVEKTELPKLARRCPVEDITEFYKIRAGGRVVDTRRARVDREGRVQPHPFYRGVKRPGTGRHHYLVQFIGPIKESWLRAVKRAGGDLRVPYEGFVYVVRADEEALARIAALRAVRWVGHLPHSARISSEVAANLGLRRDASARALPRTRVLADAYTVEFFGADDVAPAIPAIKKAGFEILNREPNTKVLVVGLRDSAQASAKRIQKLSAVHGVRVIRRRTVKRPSNDVASTFMGTQRCTRAKTSGLSGRGEIVAVCDTGLDTGDPGTIHPDFARRVEWITSYPITEDFHPYIRNPGGDDGPADVDSGHGTHVAGSVLGNGAAARQAGNRRAAIRGLAYRARLVFQAIEQRVEWKNAADERKYGRYLLAGIPLDLGGLFGDAYRRGARIHSNSWGGGAPGAYDAQCEQLDRFVWEHKDFCVLVAAGNDGTDQDGDGRINPMSVSSPGTAKNCITVGACESERPEFASETYGKWWPQDYPAAPYRNDPMADDAGKVVAFSSRGPTRDGRIKPEIVAPGTFILSTRSRQLAVNNFAWGAYPGNRLYFYMGGTSMATPLAAGAAALVREYLRKRVRLRHPSAALIKAALICGATRLPGYGGSGALCDNDQGYGRVDLDAVLAPPKRLKREFLDIEPGLRTGDVYSRSLVVRSSSHNLRLVLAYTDYPGLTLVNNLNLLLTDPNGRRYVRNQTSSGLQLDVKNNVEVIEVHRPQRGTWKVDIIGSNVPRGPQDFALVIKGSF